MISDAPRITVISHTYAIATNRQKLCHLAKLGYRLQIFAPIRRSDTLGSVEIEGRTPDEPYPVIGLPAWPAHPSAMAYWPVGLLRALSAFRPHLLHVEEEPHSMAMGEALLMLYSLPFLRDTRLTYFTWRNIYERYPFPFSWIERAADRRASIIMAGNSEARRQLVARGVSEERILVVPQMGVEPQVAAGAVRDFEGELGTTLKVGYLGRLVPEKGVETLVRAMTHTPSSIRLEICGAGPDLLRLQELVTTLRLQQRVVFVPPLPHDRVGGFLRGLDVLVLPSYTTPNWTEQFGHVLIEAMAHRVPVIGSRSGAIPEVIGAAGVTFNERDEHELAGHLQSLCANPSFRLKLARMGLERVNEHYTQAVVAAKTARAFQRALSSP